MESVQTRSSYSRLAYRAALVAAVIVNQVEVEARKYTFGVLSDIHLQPNYLPDRPVN